MIDCFIYFVVFFFKQKTAYEMRISDWSSDVCSSDLVMTALLKLGQEVDDFDAWDFIDFVDDKGAFTPNQVAMIFWRMGSAGVNYRPADWKVRMRRDSDWRQLRTMKPAAFKRRSEEHTSELQSLMRISYAVFCLKKKK